MNKKKSSNFRRLKRGSYSSLLTLIVVVIVVVANFFVAELPAKFTEIDVSGLDVYNLSDQTKELVKNLEEDITIYVVAQEENKDTMIMELLERYEELSGRIKVVTKDPALYPTFTMEYTSDTVYENSLIVESQKRHKIISYYDIYQSTITGIDYTTYEETYSTDFAGEGQITSAIDYVTTENLPTLYMLTGHDEYTFPETLVSNIEAQNIAVENLNLITKGFIPEDCDGIIISSPSRDLTEGETTQILEYLEDGGKAFVIRDYVETEQPNLDKIMATYGLAAKEGIVLEGDGDHYMQYNYFMVPEYVEHTITAPLIQAELMTCAVTAQGIEEVETDKEVEITYLLQTTEESFAKKEIVGESSLTKAEGDEAGPFSVAAAATCGETQLIYLTSSSFIDESVNTYVAGGNYDFVINAIGYICEHESAITVHAKNLDMNYIAMPAAQISIWAGILVVVIPVLCIITGFVIWFTRRKR